MPDGRKGRRWSYTAGAYPHSVRVYERPDRGGRIYYARNAGNGREEKGALGHSDRDRARDWADDEARALRHGTPREQHEPPTLARILDLYRRHRSPAKSPGEQKADERRADMFERVLGPGFDLAKLSRREWDGFVRDRGTGAIDARGVPVPNPKARRKVGARTVEADLKFLRAVCAWAMRWRTDAGELLLPTPTDPSRGFALPKEKNPRRAVATHDRVDAVREHYRKPTMSVLRDGKIEERESYLPELFEIAVGTGRRIGAICRLRVEDLELDRTPETPDGAIRWKADTDKMGKEWWCPITASVRRAVEKALLKRGQVGDGWLFPAPGDARKPLRYELASDWLRAAEKKAKLQPLDGTLWHAYRRLWATSRKGLPDVDVARAGGWASLAALKSAYQRPDARTMLRVVAHEAELREVR